MIVSSAEQPENALFPISVVPSPTTTDFNDVQSLNELELTTPTLLGIVTSTNDLQRQNASLPIDCNESLKLI